MTSAPLSAPLPVTAEAARETVDSQGWWTKAVLLLLVLIPTVFNAIALWPEVSLPIPSLNDDASHYLFIQRSSEALANAENPFDHWVPELEFGFPQFFYYQHLPHLAVVFLHRLLLKQVDLLTLFNLTRYLLMLSFPVTVYWAMRRMEFSVVAGAVGAAVSTLIQGRGYGIEYGSYVWGGHGMYTQIWAVHLSLITLACLYVLRERGEGYVAAVVACSALLLSHLIYSYIIALGALVMLLTGLNRANFRARFARFAVTGALALVIGSYLWLPLLFLKAYASASVYLERWKYDSFGAKSILTWLADGELLDHQRLPVLTLLLALGVGYAILARTRPARLVLALFVVTLAFSFGRVTWGRLADLVPLGTVLHSVRFLGGAQLAAIILIGLGGEWLWLQSVALPGRWPAAAFALVLLGLMIPALQERRAYYRLNTQWMERTRDALDADADAPAMIAAIKELPPGRAYAGLRANNWGNDPKMKWADLRFTDLLTFTRVVAASPPYQGLSLSSDLIWHFDDRNAAQYDLLNVRYAVAPSGLAMSEFLHPIKTTPRYTLYQVETTGYARFAAVKRLSSVSSQAGLFFQNRDWFLSGEPAAGNFVRYEYPAARNGSTSLEIPGCPDGVTRDEQVLPGRIDIRAECPHASTLVLKMTYHPNWRVAVDGVEVETFMVSPGFTGITWPAGAHQVRAEYRSPVYKTALLLLGAGTLMATICFRRRFARLDAVFSSKR